MCRAAPDGRRRAGARWTLTAVSLVQMQEKPSDMPKVVSMEEDLQSPFSSPGPKTRPPTGPARLDSLREKLLTSIGALVTGLHKSNSSKLSY